VIVLARACHVLDRVVPIDTSTAAIVLPFERCRKKRLPRTLRAKTSNSATTAPPGESQESILCLSIRPSEPFHRSHSHKVSPAILFILHRGARHTKEPRLSSSMTVFVLRLVVRHPSLPHSQRYSKTPILNAIWDCLWLESIGLGQAALAGRSRGFVCLAVVILVKYRSNSFAVRSRMSSLFPSAGAPRVC
jgi:hypothetical protein